MQQDGIRTVSPGEIIFREGDAGDWAYLIETGKVLVYLSGDDQKTELPLRTLDEGEVFGEMALIDDAPRSASCRAIGECRLIVVTKDQLMGRIESSDPVVRLLMAALLERLRSQNDAFRGKPGSGAKVALAGERREAVERIEFEVRILNGLNSDEFAPFYQPIYDLNTGELKGSEALLRWNAPDAESISASVFTDVMERSSLILTAGRIVIEKATHALKEMRTTFSGSDLFVSLNVSARQLSDPAFLEHLDACLKTNGLDADRVKLELTERVMTEGQHAMSLLHQCRSHGYSLAIDDFGTGFSSLQYLVSMPLTDLKIDRMFVVRMVRDTKSYSIIKSLIGMASSLGLRIIAEGIQTPEELAMLRNLDVSLGQGFLFSKAIPLEEFLKLSPVISMPFLPPK